MGRQRRWTALLGLAVVLILGACSSDEGDGSTSGPEASERYQIALNMSYSGNNWQEEAANLIKGAAATPPYDTMVELRVDIAGADVTKQIQTLNNEIDAGIDAIIIYPISPTALNETIKRACDAGIIVYAYDSLLTEPCAYNVHPDQYVWGMQGGTWLAETLGGQGDVANITGVPGTTVDTDRQKGVHDAFANYPGIRIVGEENGAWAQAQGKTAFASIYAAHPDLDGIITETGCYSITQYLLSLGKDPLPCGGEWANGHLLYMMKPEVCAEVGVLESNCVGFDSWGMPSPVWVGELAFLNSVRILEGETVGHNIIVPATDLTSEQVWALGADAYCSNPAEGCVVMPIEITPMGFVTAFWSPLVEQGLQAALYGASDKISDALPCSQVEGCQELDGLTFDENHSGGN